MLANLEWWKLQEAYTVNMGTNPSLGAVYRAELIETGSVERAQSAVAREMQAIHKATGKWPDLPAEAKR